MEKRLFYNWVVRRNGYLSFAGFALKRAVHKAKRDLLRETSVFYPPEIRAAAPFAFRPQRPVWAFGGKAESAAPACKLEGLRIDWTRQFDDPEDLEALHRWSWLLSLLPERTANKGAIARWAGTELSEWARLFSSEIDDGADGFVRAASLKWGSYTVGERISNAVLFYYFLEEEPPKAVLEALCEHARFLVRRLEYNGHRTGNHVFNNARALYLAGVALDAPAWQEFASLIIRRELPILVTGDGFLREGSSHYQFLFTRWLLEVAFFAGLSGDRNLVEMISPTLERLVRRCSFFLVKGADGRCDFPRFGDISPDFPPAWLADLPWSGPAASLVEPCSRPPAPEGDTWAGLFGYAKGPEREREKTGETIQVFPASGWHRIDAAGHTLFFRFDESGPPMHAGHHHNDLFHFCLFYMGEPVLVDAGRLNYMADDSRGLSGLRPEAHNAFTIDGLGAAPAGWHLFPQEYSRFRNRVEVEEGVGGCRITLISDAFSRMERPVEARRSFSISRGRFRITDSFSGEGRREIRSFFHWDKDLALSETGKGEWRISCRAGQGSFRVLNPASFGLRHVRGGKDYLGWVVERYGHAAEADTVEVTAIAELPCEAAYEISWEERPHVRD